MNCNIEEDLDIDAEIMKAHIESNGWDLAPNLHRKSPFQSIFLYVVFGGEKRSIAIPLPEKEIHNKHRVEVSDKEREDIRNSAVDSIMNCHSLIKTAHGAKIVLDSLSRFVNIGLGDDRPLIIGKDKVHFVLHVSMGNTGCLTVNSAILQSDSTVLDRNIVERFTKKHSNDD